MSVLVDCGHSSLTHHPGRAPALHGKRAEARRTIEIPGASHAIAASYPEATAQRIREAAAQPVAA
jgi:hypothetical protein